MTNGSLVVCVVSTGICGEPVKVDVRVTQSTAARPGVTSCGLAKSAWLRCLHVFVDRAIEDGTASDRGSSPMRDLRTSLRWPLSQSAMWPVFVVVGWIAGQDGRQMPLTGDEHAIDALPADGAHPAFGEGRSRAAPAASRCTTERTIIVRGDQQ
nr:hypothetical protein asmbl_12 [uncultured bacterium]